MSKKDTVNTSGHSRAQLALGNVLIYVAGVLLIGSAGAKVAQIPAVVENFRVLGYEGLRLTSIAMLEAVCSVLFMIPRTRSLGLLLVSAYLGGAIAVHVGHGQWGAVRPAIFLAIIWLGARLRYPHILWSFNNTILGADQVLEAHRRDWASPEA